ncbi:MAG: Bro-N domain-containing protein [Candidatus Gracilibacteria bacterium]|nr:Bro-N domain-containing protein [Candidatus Gracilibacteria bacterium]MDD2908813.1 Bro-N domain-containing protein [Candidatus Gracilibacteria bacterium]
MPKSKLTLFEGKQIRRIWDKINEKWYFSVVDVVGTLSDSKDSRKYWNKLKQRLKEDGSEVVTKCHQLKLTASDGKMRLTDVADTESIFRIIQSIPSPNAEPFKNWLARVGYERIEESEDPELGINRALNNYLAKGYSEDWINQRLKTIEIRKQLTDEWKKTGVLDREYGILTDEITRAWAGITTKEYKNIKGLKKENPRDNMSNLELILNMLAEATTTEITKTENPKGLEQNKKVAKKGGEVAGNARKEIERKTGKSVISGKNNLKKLK